MKLVILIVFFVTSAASVFACGEGMPGSSSRDTANYSSVKASTRTKPFMKKRPRCLPTPFFGDIQLPKPSVPRSEGLPLCEPRGALKLRNTMLTAVDLFINRREE